jgi:hypothetical protein
MDSAIEYEGEVLADGNLPIPQEGLAIILLYSLPSVLF